MATSADTVDGEGTVRLAVGETAEIPHDDLTAAMAEADVLDIYLSLPEAERRRFSRWVRLARDDDSYWRRIEALVLAMRVGLLARKMARPEVRRKKFGDL